MSGARFETRRFQFKLQPFCATVSVQPFCTTVLSASTEFNLYRPHHERAPGAFGHELGDVHRLRGLPRGLSERALASQDFVFVFWFPRLWRLVVFSDYAQHGVCDFSVTPAG